MKMCVGVSGKVLALCRSEQCGR